MTSACHFWTSEGDASLGTLVDDLLPFCSKIAVGKSSSDERTSTHVTVDGCT